MNKSVVRYWVFKYMEKGEESLMENMTGKTPKGNYSRTPISKRQKKDINKEIYTELEHLRTEVAYLKKLNALAWDIDESRRKKKPR